MCLNTPSGPRVKLLDFGLAQVHGPRFPASAEISGTLGFIAPEVLQGRAATPQADLYSFGVLAFELLAGRPLWGCETVTALLAATLSQAQAPSIDDAELSPALRSVLQRLLGAQPTDRFASAEETAAALAAAVDIKLPVESGELRDCVIGSAELVGREVELNQLRDALREVRKQRGQLILLAGESGIGKSRLLEELRTLAMVEGVGVLPVQARSDGTTDLGLFAEALRTLCLAHRPSTLGCSVLKGIISDLPLLLDCEIADPPEIDAQAARKRLMDTVESMLLDVQQPTLVLLEDLHWAGPDCIEMLRLLSTQLASRALLLVGTYRSDERPALETELDAARVIPLSRLNRDDIARLSTSILGATRASARLLDWLIAESEGNSFFITEVMRAVAEDAGSLDAVGVAALPQGIVTGGMDAVLRRRIEKVPAWAQPLLRLSAIAGRQLRLEMLRHVDTRLDDWLRICAAAGVLEVHQPSWRFTHDKLRERLLADISADEKRTLHRQAAEAIEHTHRELDRDIESVAATLAYHFEQAHELARAAYFAKLAGEGAARRGALAEAHSLLKRARALQDQLATPALEKAHTQRLLAETLYGLVQFEAGASAAKDALALLGRPMPASGLPLKKATLRAAGTQLLNRIFHRVSSEQSRPKDQVLEEAWLHALLSQLNGFLGRFDDIVYSSLYQANVGDAHRDLANHYPFTMGLAFLFSMMPLRGLGDIYVPEIDRLRDEKLDSRTQLQVLTMSGIIYHFRGDQHTALALSKKALAIADERGDSTAQKLILNYLNRAQIYLGDFATAITSLTRLIKQANTMADGLWREFAHFMIVVSHLIRGEFPQAREQVDQLLAIDDPNGQRGPPLAVHAHCLALLGRRDEAQTQLAESLSYYEKAPMNILIGVEAFVAPVETALLLCELATSDTERFAARVLARRALRTFQRFAMMYHHAWGVLCLSYGRLAWLEGHVKRAAWLFQRARHFALRCQCLPTAARALCWQGRAQSGASGQRLIEEGLVELRRFEARWEIQRVSSWLYSPR